MAELGMNVVSINRNPSIHPFLQQAEIELKRAERYRIFISLVVLDLSFAEREFGEQATAIIDLLGERTRRSIRDCDYVALLGNNRLAVLFPETSRQGAEIGGRRLADIIRQELEQAHEVSFEDVIPMEMVSYPDAAGTKTVARLIEELVEKSRN